MPMPESSRIVWIGELVKLQRKSGEVEVRTLQDLSPAPMEEAEIRWTVLQGRSAPYC